MTQPYSLLSRGTQRSCRRCALVLRRALVAAGLLAAASFTPSGRADVFSDRDPQKWPRLIPELLERAEFADFSALKWADPLRSEEKTTGAKGDWVFHRWVRDQVAVGRPITAIFS